MAELAAEQRVALDDLPEVVRAAHTYAGLLRFASTDFVRQFVRLFATQPVPVYAHLPVARAGLEAAATSAWLTEFSIGPERRVQRFLILRVQNALEMRRGPIPEFKQMGRDLIERTRLQCDKRGWTHDLARKRVLSIADESLPSTKSLIRALFARGRAAPETGRIGETSWWYLSGVSHSTLYALTESIDWQADKSESAVVPSLAAMFTSSQSVIQHSAVLALGFDALIEAHRELFGWESAEWTKARGEMASLIRSVVHGPSSVQVPQDNGPEDR
jgi:hypothetical protein